MAGLVRIPDAPVRGTEAAARHPSQVMEDLAVNAPLLVLAIRNKRDIVQARQRIRQTAGLLGFDVHEQTALASAVFEIACKLRRESFAGEIRLHVEGDAL